MSPAKTKKPIEIDARPIAWKGPDGWSGRAVPRFAEFAFDELPWRQLKKAGRSRGSVHCVKASNSRRVFRISSGPPSTRARSGEVTYAKRYLVNNWRRKLSNRIVGSKAAREFALGHELLAMGIPTPLPLAFAEHRRDFFLPDPRGRKKKLSAASYLLTLEWPNAGSLRDVTRERRDDPKAVEMIWARAAGFLARAHARGFYHDDCSAEHILVAPGAAAARQGSRAHRAQEESSRPDFASLAFIDIDNGRIFESPVSTGRRWINLFQLIRSMTKRSFAPELRERFVAAYLSEAKMESEFGLERACRAVDSVARRKIGRPVMRG